MIQFALALIFSISAAAAVDIGPALGRALDNNGAQPVTVIFQFADVGPAPSFEVSSPEQSLRESARASQAQAIQKMGPVSSTQNLESIWLTNSLVGKFYPTQIRTLLSSDHLRSAEISQPLKIISGISNSAPEIPHGFTYSLQKMRIPELRAALPGLDGRGVRVGILDTGIDPDHPDLAGKIAVFRDFISGSKAPYDNNYHGTHVAGIIGGSPNADVAVGVAPGVKFVVGKAFDNEGISSEETILRAMQWIADPDGDPLTPDAPQIVSNSWSSGRASGDPGMNIQCRAIAAWIKLGIVPVFAAGNSGPDEGSVGVPGACPAALSVGATDENDEIAKFSSRGYANWSNGTLLKPDVSAPGVNIYSTMPGGGYGFSTGTSMAAPYVAGFAALMIQAKPHASPEQIMQYVRNSSVDLGTPGADTSYGAGRVDASALMPNLHP